MSTFHIIQTVIEFLLVLCMFWGIFNEQKLVRFERSLFARLRRSRLKIVRGNTSARKVKLGND